MTGPVQKTGGLAARNISFAYERGHCLFRFDSLEIKPGECVGLTGVSGSGKSTLCHIFCGIIPRSVRGTLAGDVYLFEKKLSELSLLETVKGIGIVFQDPDSRLFLPTVEDEVAFGPENICLPKQEIGNRIDYCLKLLNIGHLRHADPGMLSGGQKQLVALAAALSLDPDFLVFDEALSRLDEDAKAPVLEAVRMLKEAGKGVLMAEHDEDNLIYADRILRLENGGLTACKRR